MSIFKHINSDASLDEIAAEWLYEREEGLTNARAAEFAEWCKSDSRHAHALARVERTLALFHELPTVRSLLEERLADANEKISARRQPTFLISPRNVWLFGAAAVLAIGFLASWMAFNHRSLGRHYLTDEAAQRSLVLADGSIMDLNVGSDVAVNFTAKERRVTLIKGQAHFRVAHNAGWPFIVSAGPVSVRAVGTAFSVGLGTEAVDVLVVEGKVELARDGVLTKLPSVAVPPLLYAGERAEVPRNNRSAAPKIDRVDAKSIRMLLTWDNPMTSFTDVPLREVVERFNRVNKTQLVLEDADLGERKIGGTIALDQVDAFVRMLEQDGEIVSDRLADGQIGLRRAR